MYVYILHVRIHLDLNLKIHNSLQERNGDNSSNK